eukprot:383360-Prymnesium_polylepis.1
MSWRIQLYRRALRCDLLLRRGHARRRRSHRSARPSPGDATRALEPRSRRALTPRSHAALAPRPGPFLAVSDARALLRCLHRTKYQPPSRRASTQPARARGAVGRPLACAWGSPDVRDVHAWARVTRRTSAPVRAFASLLAFAPLVSLARAPSRVGSTPSEADRHDDCSEWAATGECEHSPRAMRATCAC